MKEKIKLIVNDLKEKGFLGNELICEIYNRQYNPEDDKRIYFVKVLSFKNRLTYMINPFTNEHLRLVFETYDKNYYNGDFIACKYFISESEYNLVEIDVNNIRKLLKTKDIENLYGKKFYEYLEKRIGNEGPVISMILINGLREFYSETLKEYEKNLEKVDFLKDTISNMSNKKNTLENDIDKFKSMEKKLKLNIENSEKELKLNIEKKGNELKKLNVESNEIKNDIDELKKIKENLILEIEEKEIFLNRVNSNIEKELQIKENIKNSIELLEKDLRKYFFNESYENKNIDKASFIFENNIKKISAIIRNLLYHYEDENLIYQEETIRKFYKALISDQIILLTGPSGTGKSSLVNQIGKIVNEFVVYNIPVQSNWTDVQDLLGFFNPLENKYISTPFLDALVQAKLEPEKIHIICLDEMNLSHIEYYLSTLLSVREKKSDERYLELYSKRIYYNEKQVLLKMLNISECEFMEYSIEDLNELINSLDSSKREIARNKFELIYYYHAKFEIPKNVRFVGTLNMDETVKPLSPKVIDRSFVIEIDHIKDYKKNKFELEKNKLDGILSIDINQFLSYTKNDIKFGKIEELYLSKIENILNEIYIIPNTMINGRARKHIKTYINIETYKNEFYKNRVDDIILNEVIESKILPRIQFSKSDVEKMNAFSNFIKKLPELSCKEKAINMLNKDRVVQFWE